MTTVPDTGLRVSTSGAVDPGAVAVDPDPGADDRPRRPRPSWLELGAVVALLLLAVVVHRGTMGQQLVEQHGFRQTQTAMTAVDFKAYGIDLLHPRVPVFGARSELPFEFPLFQALATIPMNLGINADASLRVTALACFLLTAVLLFGLVRRVGGRLVAFFTLAAFLLSPFGLEWSRAALVEFLATSGAVGFVWAGIEWRERRHWVFVLLAVVAGSVAMAVKITTGVFWILPLVLYTAAKESRGFRAWCRARLDPGLVVAVVLPLLVGLAWTRHADAIKASDAATNWLTSSNLQDWNFGTLAQRTVSENWTTILDRIEQLLVGRSLFLVVLALALWWGRRQRFWLGIALVVVLAPVVLFNLYLVHDYYLAAIAPALAALVGLVAARLWRIVTAWRPGRWGLLLAGLLLVAWFGWVLWPAASYVDRMYHPVADPYVEAASEVTGLTPSGAPIVVLGEAWNPTMPYYAGRSAFMYTPQIGDPTVLDRLPREGYHYVFSFDPLDDPLHVLDRWPWIGVLGARTYVVGSRREEVAGASIVASSTTGALPSDTEVTLTCDATTSIPLPAAGADIDVAPSTRKARIWVRNDRAPLPSVGHITTDSAGVLRCAGVKSIRVVVTPHERGDRLNRAP